MARRGDRRNNGVRSHFRSVAAILIAVVFPGLMIFSMNDSGHWKRVSGPSGERRAAAAAARVGPRLMRELAAKGLRMGDPVFLRIFKESKELEVWIRQPGKKVFKLFKTYPVATWGSGKLGPKLKQGDGQAPEGFYSVDPSQMNPNSRFHLAFNLGYPNAFDRAHDRTGDFLMVHGNKVSIGCYAMTDPLIEEIYTLTAAALKQGQPSFHVHALPFRLTALRMKQAKDSKWISFWENLKEGDDWFEEKKMPPEVTVKNGRYRFAPQAPRR